RIYGLEKEKKGGALTEETKENAAAIAKLGKTGLRLENDDDWRRFLLEKFEARKAKEGPAAAFTAVIRLLESFLQIFTTHTPYNIEDFGDNHLTKEFPRALTGQLIHDCGVYALRIAYMLSLLRGHKDLNLRFRFIVLPVHVGLIITGAGLPAYIAHNDRIVIFSAKSLAEVRDAWIRTDEKGDPKTPAAKPDEEQFLAELAGQEFIAGVDLPYALLEVPEPKGGEAKVKADLWSFYTKKVAPVELFGPVTKDPKSEFYQFHLRYLEVIERMKAHWNKSLVPFWNGAHLTWLKHEPGLTKAFAKLTATKPKERKAAQEAYDKRAEEYRKLVEPRFDAVSTAFEPILAAQVEIVGVLSEHPEIIKKGIPLTRSARVEEVFRGPWWSRDFSDHLLLLMARREVAAPFAKPEDLLQPID
ncbi:MAG: hypothetical protein L0Z50_17905, partial [Verrucomicrobiales bacterium]|nr:hypothetical protein [Verrucomicrobiales bacterium]